MTIPQYTVRVGTIDDIDALAEFIEPFVRDGRLLPRTTEELSELVNVGFVAESDGKLVGFAALEIYSKKLAEIRSLAVAAEMQGRGVGSELVARCVARATERNILEVMVVTSSEGFFKQCGFDFTLPGEKKALFLQTREDTSG